MQVIEVGSPFLLKIDGVSYRASIFRNDCDDLCIGVEGRL